MKSLIKLSSVFLVLLVVTPACARDIKAQVKSESVSSSSPNEGVFSQRLTIKGYFEVVTDGVVFECLQSGNYSITLVDEHDVTIYYGTVDAASGHCYTLLVPGLKPDEDNIVAFDRL